MNNFATNSATAAPVARFAQTVTREQVVREIEKAMRISDKTLREAAKEVAVCFAEVVRGQGGDQAAQMAMLQFVVTIAGEMLDEIGAR